MYRQHLIETFCIVNETTFYQCSLHLFDLIETFCIVNVKIYRNFGTNYNI